MKGIILAGGTGSRLFPATFVTSKQLLPIYDKPMIYYPLSTLMLAGIKDILIISTERDLPAFKSLLKDGSDFGINLSYIVQDKPRGLAEAFILGKDFIGNDCAALILGDNIFYGNGLSKLMQNSVKNIEQNGGCELYSFTVADPENFGIAYEKDGKVVEIIEKPQNSSSNLAVTGLYFYDNKVVEIAKNVKPSARGELEITSINNDYVRNQRCKINKLGRGSAWLDTGTHESMLRASTFISTIQNATGTYLGCLEEVAYRMHFIDKEKVLEASKRCAKTEYGKYLMEIYNE